MLAMISNQYLRQQPTLQNRDEEHLNELNKYFSSSVQLLTAVRINYVIIITTWLMVDNNLVALEYKDSSSYVF